MAEKFDTIILQGADSDRDLHGIPPPPPQPLTDGGFQATGETSGQGELYLDLLGKKIGSKKTGTAKPKPKARKIPAPLVKPRAKGNNANLEGFLRLPAIPQDGKIGSASVELSLPKDARALNPKPPVDDRRHQNKHKMSTALRNVIADTVLSLPTTDKLHADDYANADSAEHGHADRERTDENRDGSRDGDGDGDGDIEVEMGTETETREDIALRNAASAGADAILRLWRVCSGWTTMEMRVSAEVGDVCCIFTETL